MIQPERARIPLNDTQLSVWWAWRNFPDHPLNHQAIKVEWRTALDRGIFQQALTDLVARTDALRLRFEEAGDQVRQYASAPDGKASLPFRDFSDDDDDFDAANAWLSQIETRPFDLTSSVFVAALAKCADDRWLFLLSQHRAASDFHSSALLIERLAQLYAERKGGQLPAPTPYPSFLDFQQRAGSSRAKVTLDGPRPARLLPYLPAEAEERVQPKPMVRLSVPLGRDRMTRLPGTKALLDTVLATTLAVISRLSGEARVAVGAMAPGRSAPGSEPVAGPLMQLLPVAVEIEESWTCADLMHATHAAHAAVLSAAREGAPINGPRVAASVTLIDKALPNFDGVPSREITPTVTLEKISRDLNVAIRTGQPEAEPGLLLSVNREVVDSLGAEKVAALYVKVFDAITETPDLRLREVPLFNDADMAREKSKAQAALDALPAPYETLVEGFLDQVARTPEATAVRDAQGGLTYRDLEQNSARIAAGLMARGIGPGAVVALRLPRTPMLVATVLGILRAGGIYLALDKRLPDERIAFMLENAAACLLVLPHDELADADIWTLPHADPETLLEEAEGQAPDLPQPDPEAAMYIMYTSGTTSEPKGTLIPHRSFAIFNAWAGEVIAPGQPITWALATTLSFEPAYRAFVALTTGGTIVTYEAPDSLTGMSVIDALRDDAVDGLAVTPSQLRLLCGETWQTQRLRTLISVGEQLPTDLAHRVRQAFGSRVALQNWYGPTESTMATTAHVFDPEQDTELTVPIGQVARGAAIHVLDEVGQPLPDGLIGEICVGGVRLSRGYLNRPETTAEKFIPDPFRPGGTLYRTGDLGRFNSLGALVYHGRNDDQVKVNGVRIELAEVEAGVAQHPAVRKCAAVVFNEPDNRLAAFYTAEADIPADDLRRATETVLARVMVPSLFLRLDAIPLTATGKTNRRALKALVEAHIESGVDAGTDERDPPVGATETSLAQIWARLLQRQDIARQDDFFASGGDSLSFVQMILLAEKELGRSIPIGRMTGVTSLRDMAQMLDQIEPEPDRPTPATPSFGVKLVSRAKRLIRRSFRPARPGPVLPPPGRDLDWLELRRRIMLAAQGWQGMQMGLNLPVLSFNPDGSLPPLFWCFNGAMEPPMMARELGGDQPLYALRSMQAVLEKDQKSAFDAQLAGEYAEEILRLQPEGPYFLGGNCQSGRIAEAMAGQLIDAGKDVAGLFLLDYTPRSPLPVPVSLFFGKDSHEFNPFLSQAHPERAWQKLFASVTWDIVPGGHGQYFHPRNAPVLISRLSRRLSAVRGAEGGQGPDAWRSNSGPEAANL